MVVPVPPGPLHDDVWTCCSFQPKIQRQRGYFAVLDFPQTGWRRFRFD